MTFDCLHYFVAVNLVRPWGVSAYKDTVRYDPNPNRTTIQKAYRAQLGPLRISNFPERLEKE